jgi:hypothetical protein
VTAFGDPQQNGVNVSLHAQMKVNANIFAAAETWYDHGDGNFPVELLIGVIASNKLNLWPVLQSQDFDFDLTLDKSNIDLSDLRGEAIGLGTKLGIIIGFTPVGLALGGPLTSAVLGFLGGSKAAEIAEQKIKAKADKAINDQLKKASDQIKAEVQKAIVPVIAQANNLKDQLLNTKFPGVNKSYNDLSSAFGLTLDVQTTTPSGFVNAIATPRFAAAPGGGTFSAKLRIPKDQCMYFKNLILGVIPFGFQAANQDLAPHVGHACSTVFQPSDLQVKGYLGGDPAIVPGGGANPLLNWKGVGSVSFQGNLTDHATESTDTGLAAKHGYYECAFQVSNLPDADIIELSGAALNRLGDAYNKEPRYFEAAVGGQQVVLDADWKPVPTPLQGVAIGGEAKCEPGSSGMGRPATFWEELRDKLDPETCPQCGIRLKGNIVEFSNPGPMLQNPKAKRFFDEHKIHQQLHFLYVPGRGMQRVRQSRMQVRQNVEEQQQVEKQQEGLQQKQ